MDRRQHWQTIYQDRDSKAVSWFRPHLESSLAEIGAATREMALLPESARILDAGGGASTLVDDLIGIGYRRVTVVDLAPAALEIAQRRLGPHAATVQWICGDLLTDFAIPSPVDIWHDRAVFHFLCTPEQRAQYRKTIWRALVPGGHLIVATFGPQGPERCSGLPTMRFSSDELAETMGNGFTIQQHQLEIHATPSGADQQFLLAHFRRND